MESLPSPLKTNIQENQHRTKMKSKRTKCTNKPINKTRMGHDKKGDNHQQTNSPHPEYAY